MSREPLKAPTFESQETLSTKLETVKARQRKEEREALLCHYMVGAEAFQ